MKKTKKVFALLLSVAMVLSMAACGDKGNDSGKSGGDSTDPKTLIAEASKKMEDVKSMDADMVMNMAMTMQGQTMNMDMTMKMSVVEEPMALKADVSIKASGMGQDQDTTMTMYGEQAEDKDQMTLYVSPDGTTWAKQTTDISAAEQYQAKDDMDLYLKSGTGFKLSGTEKVGDADAYKLDGTISKDEMAEVMKSSGALDQVSALLQGTSVDDLVKDLGDMPISIWIDKESGYPVKYSMDMTEIMSGLMSKVMESAGAAAGDFTFDKMTMEMTCSNFDKVGEIEIPQAAKDAPESTDLGL